MAEEKKVKKGKPVQDEMTSALLPESDERVAKAATIGLVVSIILGFWFATIELAVDEIMFDEEGQEELAAMVNIVEEKKEE